MYTLWDVTGVPKCARAQGTLSNETARPQTVVVTEIVQQGKAQLFTRGMCKYGQRDFVLSDVPVDSLRF